MKLFEITLNSRGTHPYLQNPWRLWLKIIVCLRYYRMMYLLVKCIN